MKSNVNMRWRAVLLAALMSCAAGWAVASRSVELVDTGRTQLVALDQSAPMTATDVRRAIILGGQVRRWQPIGDQPGVVTLEIDNDRHRLAVDVAYDAHGFEIKYKSSTNLNYSDSGGTPTIHPTAVRWIGELATAIRKTALTPHSANQ